MNKPTVPQALGVLSSSEGAWGFGYHTDGGGQACSAPATYNFVWVETGASGRVFNTKQYPRSLWTEGDEMASGSYGFAVCDATAGSLHWDYPCIIWCNDGVIDYSMCGPGGEAGKGEAFVEKTCVHMRETRLHKDCGIDFTSEDTYTTVWDFDITSPTFGQEVQQSLADTWRTVYDYLTGPMLPEAGNSMGLYATHSDANLMKFGMVYSSGTHFSSSLQLAFAAPFAPNFGHFAQIIPDFFAKYCAATNNTGVINPADYPNADPSFFEQFADDAPTFFSFFCTSPLGTNNYFFGDYPYLVSNFNLWTMTSTDEPELTPHTGPKIFTPTSYSGTLEAGTTFEDRDGDGIAESVVNPPEFQPAGLDPSLSDGDVFWPEMDPYLACFFRGIPAEMCAAAPGLNVFIDKPPESYTLDLPVTIDQVATIPWDPCMDLDDPDVQAAFAVNPECYHLHQGGLHLRNGQFYPIVPTLLNGHPDFFGVCTAAQTAKAYFVPSDHPKFPGMWMADATDPDHVAAFEAMGGTNLWHGKDLGIHYCVDPEDPYNPVNCILNLFDNIPNLRGLENQMILDPVGFIQDSITDKDNLCVQSTKHWCPWDDYWMTVDVNYDEINNPIPVITEVRDFFACQKKCMDEGLCDPENDCA